MYQPASTTSRRTIRANLARRESSRIASPAVARKDGVVSVVGVAGDGLGGSATEPLPGAVFSSLAPLFVICVLHVAHSLGQIDSGLVETVESVDLVGAGTRQCVLSGDDFDVRRDSGCEATFGLRDLVVRELKSQVGDADVFACCIQFVNRRLHFANNAGLQELAILLDTLLLQVCSRNLGVNPPTGEERNVEADLIPVRGNAIIKTRALVKPYPREIDLRHAFFRRRFLFEMRDALL